MRMADRAVSTVVGYTLLMAVIGVLASGVIVGATGYVESERADATRAELDVIGNELAADLTAADALAETVGADGSARVDADLPHRVAGAPYHLEIVQVAGSRYAIELASTPNAVSTTVTVASDHSVTTGRFTGGRLTIAITDDQLAVSHD